MTRANLNFVWQNQGEAPRLLFHYHNGDQYPEGLLQFFGIEEFLTIDRLWTPENYRSWIRRNYRQECRKVTRMPDGGTIDAHADGYGPADPEDLGEGGQPKIIYTGGFITDYSYVFTHRFKNGRERRDGSRVDTKRNWVTAWHYEKLIFDGPAPRFLNFCRKCVEPEVAPGNAAVLSAVTDAPGKLHA